jgi:hypothetical protein
VPVSLACSLCEETDVKYFASMFADLGLMLPFIYSGSVADGKFRFEQQKNQ